MAEYDRVVRTRTLARIVGPYLVVVAATLFARQEGLPEFLLEFMQDRPLVLATGAFTLMAGLALIVAHHHWSSASACVISFIGFAAALKGASLMAAPDFGADMTAVVTAMPYLLPGAIGVELLVGIWLSIVGWIAPARAASSPSR